MSYGTDAAAVKVRLLGDLEAFLFKLLPEGKVHGHEFRVGSLSGEKGQSLVVELRGPKAGLWVDRNGGKDFGDIFTLAGHVWGLNFKETLARCCEQLGISNVERPAVKPRPPAPDTTYMGRMLGTNVYSYLLRNRGILDETMRTYELRTYDRVSEWGRDHIAFSFLTPELELAFIKTLGVARKPDGKKDVWSTPPWWTLWGWWMVKDHHREIIITEGEIDAMSVWQMMERSTDIPVLSLPNGTNGTEWIENDYEALRQFEVIYILTDNDNAGEDCAKEIARRLGRARCKRVRYPAGFKDGNEVLTRGDDVHMNVESWLAEARTFDPSALVRVSDLDRDFENLRNRRKASAAQNDFLWPKFAFQFRDGETTLFSGYPFSGKSTLLYQTHLHEMRMGRTVLFASFEILPEEMLLELLTLMGCDDTVSEEEWGKCRAWLNERMVFIRPPDPYPFETLLEDIRYAISRYGVRRVAIDSLHYLAGKEEWEEQDKVVRQIHRLGKETLAHIALVAHSPKTKDMTHIPGMFDVEGSGGIVKPIDNILTCWRNIEKEETIRKAEEADDVTKLDKAKALHDGVVCIRKQRLGGKLPFFKVWHSSLGFRTSLENDIAPTIPTQQPKELF